jgi:hypothetical protein
MLMDQMVMVELRESDPVALVGEAEDSEVDRGPRSPRDPVVERADTEHRGHRGAEDGSRRALSGS